MTPPRTRAPIFAKRHYEVIAFSVAELALPPDARALTALTLADAFEQDNPAFDYKRFMEACDVPTNTSRR